MCDVAECRSQGLAWVEKEDEHGQPGMRCARHKGRAACGFEGCRNVSHRIVPGAGPRCFSHGAAAECSVAGCPKKAQSRGKCLSHGGRPDCSVMGCVTKSAGLVKENDRFGEKGHRCKKHGARVGIY